MAPGQFGMPALSLKAVMDHTAAAQTKAVAKHVKSFFEKYIGLVFSGSKSKS